MNKEKVFAWIESLEEMADQSDRYFVERTELYKENQEKDKEIDRLNNIINEYTKWLEAHLDDEFYWFKMYSKLQKLKEDNK